MKSSREYYKETFFPSVTDAAKATIVAVTEGSVMNDVDIVLGRAVATFRVAGRVIDGETGRPIPISGMGWARRLSMINLAPALHPAVHRAWLPTRVVSFD
jgi:hypothetical protein